MFLITILAYQVNSIAPENLHFLLVDNEEEEVGFGLVRQFREGCNWISSVMQCQLANKKRTAGEKQNLVLTLGVKNVFLQLCRRQY